MDVLRKLHKLLKQDQPLRQFIALVQKIAAIIATKSPQQFALSQEHELLCNELEKMKLNSIQETFRQLPPVPEITAIILKSSKEFTLAFLMIPANKFFGWHDHANMNGISKCISGQLIIRSLNPNYLQPCSDKQFYYPVQRIRQENLTPRGQKISIIYPDSFNIHQIYAKTQSCFIDLLMPQYPDNSCHYFRTVNESMSQDAQQRLKLIKIHESFENIYGLQSLIKHFRQNQKHKVKNK